MCDDNINIYTAEEVIYKKSCKQFELVQNLFVVTPGDGIKFIPTKSGCEISRSEKIGKEITKKTIESNGILYPNGDTTIQAFMLNQNTINKIFFQLGLRNPINDLASWTNANVYFQYFNNVITMMSPIDIQSFGPKPDIKINIENFQVVIYSTGTGIQYEFKAEFVLESMQFSG